MSTEHRENWELEIKDSQGNGTAAPMGGVAMTGNVPAATPRSAELAGGQSSVGMAIAAVAADPFFSGRKHFPELDGLRGLAILMVLATHYIMAMPQKNWLERAASSIGSHGWAGVDLFFVLSGFLITGILLDSKGQRNYLRNFYARRFLRIFPLYYGFLTVLLFGMITVKLLAIWGVSAPRLTNLWHIQPWLWTYTFNIACAFGHGSAHLGQLWSLSVEEQFYLIWPLVIMLVPRKYLLQVCLALIIAALFLRLGLAIWMHQIDVYFLTPTRMDSLAFGALAALLIRVIKNLDQLRKFAAVVFYGVGALLAIRFILALFGRSVAVAHQGSIVQGIISFKYLWDNVFIFTVVGLFFFSLLLISILPGSWLGQVFSNIFRVGSIRTAGKYSYGWYVFHFPLWTFSITFLAKEGLLHAVSFHLPVYLIVVVMNFWASFFLAYTSYHLYEKHFLKLKKYFPEKFAMSAVSCSGAH